MPEESSNRRNRLLVPLVAVCVVCVAEAVLIAFLLGRAGAPAAALPAAQSSANTSAPLPSIPQTQPLPAAAAPPPAKPGEPQDNAPAIVRGKVHERVEAGGLSVTVLDVADQPRVNILGRGDHAKFADCDVLLENTGPKAFRYYAALIKLQDDQARVFDGNSIAGAGPQLGFGTLVPGGKVRGHVAFDLPSDAKGLTLIIPVNSSPQPHSIQIDLGR